MKKREIVMLVMSMICFASIGAQQQETVYGIIKTDGYYKTIKGAFWSQRPEAKAVYYGEYPDGIEVKVLETEYFVRFVDGENNHLDINYIVFPKGEKIYKKDGHWFAAICGNEINYWQKVSLVKVVEKEVYLDKPTTFYKMDRPVRKDFGERRSVVEVIIINNSKQQELPRPYIPPKKDIKIGNIIIPIAGIVAVVVGIISLNRNNDQYQIVTNTTTTEGSPGGAPVTPPVDPGGGPGGSPTTR